MRLTLSALGLAAVAVAGHNSAPTHKAPGLLLTGCPNGYTDFVTGECKPFHLRVRDAASGDWRSHKVTDAYPVMDHPWGPKNGKAKGDDDDDEHAAAWGKGAFGYGKPGGPSHHCPNGVANHGTGECRAFRMHARDADSGEWREHRVTGAYRIPDERPGMGGHGGPATGGFGGQHGGQHEGAGMGGRPAGGKTGAGKSGMGGAGAAKGGRGPWILS